MRGVPCHFQKHICSKAVGFFENPGNHVVPANFVYAIGPHFPGQIQTVIIEVTGKYPAGTCLLGNGNGDKANGAAACNENGVAHQGICQGCMHSIAKGVVDGCHFSGDFGIQHPEIAPGHPDIFCKTAVGIYTDYFNILTDVGLAGAAKITCPADKMAFCTNPGAKGYIVHPCPQLHNLAAKFMAKDQGRFDSA